ncbi:embryonic polarity protein dorsal-like isoform X3 [Macrosteles quadrilineatus]|uniref:embryonic polarity protein dorsal-like isoform X3 n=1 Tax=Macrosteles quadrilineatus TaxID=74068 RepID=UPI0023E2BE16|nr:embryonic polarity protein dorsal-like isoform X3 [Macrosteles quadrilineatus]XP_054264402.1 embryonic polarity protein dorsal-like isoform X3 [Macrosteles quadrilineatus]
MAASIMELPDNSSGINISDVIEVIETDCNSMDSTRREGPYIKIVEQPASKALRFRYECEGRSAGSIPGVNSSTENKTYPTIQIKNYKGKVVVVVSCVTKDAPYKPHPHNLVGREGCKRGVCTLEIHNDTMTQSFDHLGIQCVKKKDIEDALRIREEIRVDPFKTGFSHRTQAGSIDLNAVRLCFQAFLEDRPNSGTFTIPLVPVVSEIIYDKKALCDLAICRLSHSSATVAGGLEMILLCEKVLKEDIAVRLYEEKNGEIVWAANCEFTPAQVHKQVAITFKTPRYHTMQVDKPVQVFIQLQRPSDHETSEPLPFQLTPLDSGSVSGEQLNRKKPRLNDVDRLLIADKDPLRASPRLSPGPTVKREPADTSPNPYSVYSPGAVRVASVYHPDLEYNPMFYQALPSTSMGYQARTVTVPSLSALKPVAVSPGARLSPASSPQALGRVSPLPVANAVAVPSDIYMREPLQNGSLLDISSFVAEPMEHITVDSKDFSGCDINLSENLSNNLHLSDANIVNPLQENMTDSFTKLANTAYSEFEGK